MLWCRSLTLEGETEDYIEQSVRSGIKNLPKGPSKPANQPWRKWGSSYGGQDFFLIPLGTITTDDTEIWLKEHRSTGQEKVLFTMWCTLGLANHRSGGCISSAGKMWSGDEAHMCWEMWRRRQWRNGWHIHSGKLYQICWWEQMYFSLKAWVGLPLSSEN